MNVRVTWLLIFGGSTMVRSIALSGMLGLSVLAIAPFLLAQGPPPSVVNKLGVDEDVRSGMKILMDGIVGGTVILPDQSSPVTQLDAVSQIQFRGNNIQANNPSGDYIQQFTG